MTIQSYIDKLKYKIGDPTGIIYSHELLVGYVWRAYTKLLRILNMVMRSKKPYFANLVSKMNIGETDDQGVATTIGRDVLQIYELLCNGKKATYIDPSLYYTHSLKTSVGVATDDNPLYTIINHNLYVLPKKVMKIEIIYRHSPDDSSITADKELRLPAEYEDMLLVLAASEAMQDIGRQDKYQLYQAELNYHLQIMAQYTALKEKEEGSDVNGQ